MRPSSRRPRLRTLAAPAGSRRRGRRRSPAARASVRSTSRAPAARHSSVSRQRRKSTGTAREPSSKSSDGMCSRPARRPRSRRRRSAPVRRHSSQPAPPRRGSARRSPAPAPPPAPAPRRDQPDQQQGTSASSPTHSTVPCPRSPPRMDASRQRHLSPNEPSKPCFAPSFRAGDPAHGRGRDRSPEASATTPNPPLRPAAQRLRERCPDPYRVSESPRGSGSRPRCRPPPAWRRRTASRCSVRRRGRCRCRRSRG